MDSLPVNITDLVIIAVLLLSGILALARGLVKEVLSIAGWIGAFLLALQLFPRLSPYVQRYVEQEVIADSIAYGLIFLVTVVLLSLISTRLSRMVRDSEVGALDRSLGFLFGLARGAVIVALLYLALVQFLPPADHPSWLREARAVPLVQRTAVLLLQLAPERIRVGLASAGDWGREAQQSVDDALKAGEALKQLQQLQQQRQGPGQGSNVSPDNGGNSGYTSSQRRQIDRIIRSTADD